MFEGTLTGLPASRHGARAPLVRVGAVAGEVGEHAAGLGIRRALVVTDPGVAASGAVAPALAALAAAGVAAVVWDEVRPDPSSADVARAASFAGEIDGVVSIGGGSAMDTAKAVALVVACGGRAEDYVGYGVAAGDLLPHVAVPTTAGTGSEAQSFAILTRDADHVKVAVGHPGLMPRVVLLDARLQRSCPRGATVSAGLDALVHAVEAAVSTAASPAASACAVEALELLWPSLPAVVARPDDLEARAAMALGALKAGAAIEAGMLGAAHATANALSALAGVPHGLAVAMTLPHVVRWVAEGWDGYGPVVAAVGLSDAGAFADAWEGLQRALGAPQTVREWSGSGLDVGALTAVATGQWTARFSPRAVDEAGLRRILTAAVG
jgi:alcohol dehydrogenase